MTAASMWDARVAEVIARLTNHPGDRPDEDPTYIGRHSAPVLFPGIGSGFTFSSHLERARVAARRAEQAVLVLAATDALPASRVLYRELLHAGALTSSLRGVA